MLSAVQWQEGSSSSKQEETEQQIIQLEEC